jgi:hypothetical protein
MGNAIIHEEDDNSGILIACAPLTDVGDKNILEPGPEDRPINKAFDL